MSLTDVGLVASMLIVVGIVRFGIPAALTWACCRVLHRINPAG